MFKAKLIADPTYYRLRRRRTLLALLPVLPAALIVDAFDLPVWVTGAIMLAYVGAFWWLFRNKKSLDSLVGEQTIEIDEQAIRVLDRSGQPAASYALDRVDRLLLKKAYGYPEESLSDVANELKGTPKKNFIIVEQGGQRRQFDFVVDSYYSLKQLDKVIDGWTRCAYPIERV